MELNLPPLVFIVDDRQPSDGWTVADKKLAMAWTILQKETCNKCGNPLWVCRSSNRDVGVKIAKGLCYVSKELEKYNNKNEKNLKPGEYFYPIAHSYSNENGELPGGMRAEYFNDLAEN